MEKPAVQSEDLWNVILGMSSYQMLLVAYEYDLFELLNNEPMTINEVQLAIEKNKSVKIDVRPLEAMLGLNSSLGAIEINDKDKKFYLTEIAKTYLLKHSPYSLCGVLNMLIDNPAMISLESLKSAFITNSPFGGDAFDKNRVDIDKASIFTRAMHSISMAPAMYWPEVVNLKRHKVILDIAGGSGAHTIASLNYWKSLERGIVFDMENGCKVCEDFIEKENLALE